MRVGLLSWVWLGCSALAQQPKLAQHHQATKPAILLVTEAVRLDEAPRSQLISRRPTQTLANGVDLALGDSRFAVAFRGTRLVLATRDQGPARKAIRSGSVYTFPVRRGGRLRQQPIAFVREYDGTWSWFCADARRVKIGTHELRIVDCNADQRFTIADDGYLIAGSRTICPLANTIVLGATAVTITNLSG